MQMQFGTWVCRNGRSYISPGSCWQIVTRKSLSHKAARWSISLKGREDLSPSVQLPQSERDQQVPFRLSLPRPHYPLRVRRSRRASLSPGGLSQMRGLTCILQTPSITLPQRCSA
ncbi:unnamed protein product [Rangifer tarandus platyrhynchus]|uniref:Uncharacterized protein n=1 Tax=Rangifer tarandus platyrhynchus TaxID=3082113 RepID=A0AC59ZBA0_RANTA